MQGSTPIIDIHSHTTLKPYGNSFYSNTNKQVFGDIACIWTPDKCTAIDTVFENTLGLTRYRQADYEGLVNAQVKIVITSLYPQELGFFESKKNLPNLVENMIAQLASLLGKKRIDFIKGKGDKPYNYFTDLENEYLFLMALSGKPALGSAKIYNVIANSQQLNTASNLLVIPSIEGSHVFCNGTDTKNIANWDGLDARIARVKSWITPPLFITLAHHFYNGICTHAVSLMGSTGKILDQSEGMRNYNHRPTDTLLPISSIGYSLIAQLLSTSNGRRILIDVKHMSKEARLAYYQYLDTHHPLHDIPVICSHGALTDLYNHEVNMEKQLDILQIYKTKGLFGIELDQRVLGYNEVNKIWQGLKNWFRKKRTKEQEQLEFVWKNIILTAEHAYQNGFAANPWACICIGSDFDGIINPLNNFRDAESLPKMYQLLIVFLNEYWSKNNPIIPKNTPLNHSAEDVIYDIMYKNAYNFIVKNYI